MKDTLNNLPIRWILRLAIIAIASFATGMSFWWCFLLYIFIIFLIRFSINMIVTLIGIALIIGVFFTLFLGLLTL
jgi:hypothetical protein